MSLFSRNSVSTDNASNPELLRRAISPETAAEIAGMVFDLRRGNVNLFERFKNNLNDPAQNKHMYFTERREVEKIDDDVTDRVDSIGVELIGGFYTYNFVIYQPGSELPNHVDDENNPQRKLPIDILQLAGYSEYLDLETTPIMHYQLEPGDLLRTDGNRPHAARNSGNTDRLFVCFSQE